MYPSSLISCLSCRISISNISTIRRKSPHNAIDSRLHSSHISSLITHFIISRLPSPICHLRSAISHHPSAISHLPSPICHLLSAFCNAPLHTSCYVFVSRFSHHLPSPPPSRLRHLVSVSISSLAASGLVRVLFAGAVRCLGISASPCHCS